MYPNVRAEMARRKITLEILATELGRPVPTLSLKLNGKSPLLFEEAVAIKKALGIDMTLEELFNTDFEE